MPENKSNEKNSYLVETHTHTSEVSACGRLSARELVRLHKEAGYDALVVTDHYLHEETNSDRKRERFARGYLRAKEAGDELGLVVLPGMELRFHDGSWDDFLVFLPDPGLYRTLRGLTDMNIRSLHRLAKQKGFLVYQAHPFRTCINPAPPEALDGVEVYNGNPNQENHNERALRFAEENGLRQSSGSDVHYDYAVGGGGIYVPESALTPAGFVAYLRDTPRPTFYTPQKEVH